MADSPLCASSSMSRTLSAVVTSVFSFCSPSRGPTSTILTRAGYASAGGVGAADEAEAAAEKLRLARRNGRRRRRSAIGRSEQVSE